MNSGCGTQFGKESKPLTLIDGPNWIRNTFEASNVIVLLQANAETIQGQCRDDSRLMQRRLSPGLRWKSASAWSCAWNGIYRCESFKIITAEWNKVIKATIIFLSSVFNVGYITEFLQIIGVSSSASKGSTVGKAASYSVILARLVSVRWRSPPSLIPRRRLSSRNRQTIEVKKGWCLWTSCRSFSRVCFS